MAAAVTSDAAHSEQQLLQVAGGVFAQETAELAKTDSVIAARRVNITPNFANGTVQIVASLPITIAVDTDGGMSYDANEVLPA